MGAELFYTDGQTDRHDEASRNFGNTPKIILEKFQQEHFCSKLQISCSLYFVLGCNTCRIIGGNGRFGEHNFFICRMKSSKLKKWLITEQRWGGGGRNGPGGQEWLIRTANKTLVILIKGDEF
jgi:hypothetical protein